MTSSHQLRHQRSKLRQVGCEPPLFSNRGRIEVIHHVSHGLPRRINRLVHDLCRNIADSHGFPLPLPTQSGIQ